MEVYFKVKFIKEKASKKDSDQKLDGSSVLEDGAMFRGLITAPTSILALDHRISQTFMMELFSMSRVCFVTSTFLAEWEVFLMESL